MNAMLFNPVKNPATQTDKVLIVIRIMDDLPLAFFSIEKLAAKTFLQPRELVSLFKSVYGARLPDYLLEKRMWASTQMLGLSRLGIEQIAKASGYGNCNSFCKAFRKRYGISPGLWRKRWGILKSTG